MRNVTDEEQAFNEALVVLETQKVQARRGRGRHQQRGVVLVQTPTVLAFFSIISTRLNVHMSAPWNLCRPVIQNMVDDVDADADGHCCLSFCFNALPAI